LLHLANIIYNI